MFEKLKIKRLQQINTESNDFENIYPLLVKMSPLKLLGELEKYLKENQFQDIKPCPQFNEMYARNGDDEYTFSVTMTDTGQSILNVLLLNKKQKNHVLNEIVILLNSLKGYFRFFAEDYIE